MVPGTLEGYPLGEFGLLDVGQHRFCHAENGQEDCGTFKNILEWRKEGTGYTVSRVISYDHGNFDHRSIGRMTLLRS